MKRFVFRAQVALDFRRRQEEEARAILAAAQRGESEAQADLARALEDFAGMLRRSGEEDARPGELTARIWYRNWIAGQRLRIERCRRILDDRRADVAAATERVLIARRKVKSLERFRDRAWRTYQREAQRGEQKVLDDLGTVRFVLGRANVGGDT